MPCDHEHGGTLHSPAGTYRPPVPTQPFQHPGVSGSGRIATAITATMPCDCEHRATLHSPPVYRHPDVSGTTLRHRLHRTAMTATVSCDHELAATVTSLHTALRSPHSPVNYPLQSPDVPGKGRIVSAITATVPCDHKLGATLNHNPGPTTYPDDQPRQPKPSPR
jgi:hypothetical protein